MTARLSPARIRPTVEWRASPAPSRNRTASMLTNAARPKNENAMIPRAILSRAFGSAPGELPSHGRRRRHLDEGVQVESDQGRRRRLGTGSEGNGGLDKVVADGRRHEQPDPPGQHGSTGGGGPEGEQAHDAATASLTSTACTPQPGSTRRPGPTGHSARARSARPPARTLVRLPSGMATTSPQPRRHVRWLDKDWGDTASQSAMSEGYAEALAQRQQHSRPRRV